MGLFLFRKLWAIGWAIKHFKPCNVHCLCMTEATKCLGILLVAYQLTEPLTNILATEGSSKPTIGLRKNMDIMVENSIICQTPTFTTAIAPMTKLTVSWEGSIAFVNIQLCIVPKTNHLQPILDLTWFSKFLLVIWCTFWDVLLMLRPSNNYEIMQEKKD